jgi:hypothetical protein
MQPKGPLWNNPWRDNPPELLPERTLKEVQEYQRQEQKRPTSDKADEQTRHRQEEEADRSAI